MKDQIPEFYLHEQSIALQTFLPVLHEHFPHSNPLYNRLQAPHNLPSRHCVFAATFPPSPGSTLSVPKIYTILFADRSRHEESQIWAFNSLVTHLTPLSEGEQNTLSLHLISAIHFLRALTIPSAPGWPFSPVLRFACVHQSMTKSFRAITESTDSITRITTWNAWMIPTSPLSSAPEESQSKLPPGFTLSRVPEEQLDIVLSTSEIKRQPSTYLVLPSVGVLNESDKLVAWAYIGIDGSLATLYVLPGYRGRGLATHVAMELLRRLARGEYADLGYAGSSGWVHADVKMGNEGSEGVMKALGGEVWWVSSYLLVDGDRL